MSHMALLICIVLLTASGLAADVPFVFGEGSRDIAGFTSAQLEQASSSSSDLAGVPAISSPSDSEVLELPIVGGGSAPVGKTKTKEDDLKKTVSSRVEPDNSLVHEVALLLVAKFPGDLTIDQICSIYSYMKNGEGSVKGWSYARDPRGSDFFMYANQSLKIGGKAGCAGVGDCDDFAILMSALVESIGGTTRIIFAQNKTIGGHAYAEVYLGNLNDQKSQVNEIVNWLKQKSNTDKIYTHVITDTKDVWLNLDWGADEKGIAHPGGPFYQGERHIVVSTREFEKTSLKLSATKMQGAELSAAIPLNITTDEIESKSADVWFNKGFALNSLGKYDDAIKAYDEAIRLDPKLATAWNNNGNVLNAQGKYDEAINAFDEAIGLDANLAESWTNKGIALKNQGKYDDAIKACDEAIRLDPNLAMAWNNKGVAIIKQGKYDDAIKACDEAIRLDPKFAAAWTNKGVALGDQGKYADAIKACDEAIRLDPNFAMAWNNKGEALRKQGKYDEAINVFDEAIRLDPKDAAAWYNKGNALNNQVKYDEAIKAYDEAIRLDPNLAQARTNKGIALKNQGKYDDAIKAYDEAIRLDPNQVLAWYNKGIALGKQGKYDNAIKCFDEAIRQNPKLAAAWNAKGTALKLLGRTTEANLAFAKARELA
ncbi:MAG: tetratricopeptide repeat protein [Methanothrix sp.]|nr:tetratricopeptide repeat protein [Methanothrix sp.]